MKVWTQKTASVILLTGCWMGIVDPIWMGVQAQSVRLGTDGQRPEEEDVSSEEIDPEIDPETNSDTENREPRDREEMDSETGETVRSQVLEALELETREFIEVLRDRQEADDRRDRLIPPTTTNPRTTPPPLPVANFRDPAEWRAYPLGPGDQINIVLQPPFQELSTPAVIAFDGTVFVSLLGQISLDGLTIEESTEVLRREFNQFLVDPDVRVILSAPRAAQVTVSGAVLRPGYFPISPNAFVHEALLTAGGASVNSDLKNVIVQRRRADGSVISQSVDLYTPIAEGTPLPDVRLRDGDTIVVPERDLLFDSDYDRELLRRTPLVAAQDTPLKITILGEVARPGYYEFASAIPPLIDRAIVTAQGSKNTADLRSVLVQRRLRDGSIIEREIDLYTPLISGGSVPNFPLEDGDVVIVPKLDLADIEDYNNEVLATSTVANPQITVRLFSRALGSIRPITLANGSRLTDILAQIPLQDSSVSRIAIVRFDETLGEAVTEHYDGWEAIEGNEAENVLLRDKDIILVGRNTVATISRVLNRFTQPFRDVLGFLLFFDQLQNSATNLFSPNGTSTNNNSNSNR